MVRLRLCLETNIKSCNPWPFFYIHNSYSKYLMSSFFSSKKATSEQVLLLCFKPYPTFLPQLLNLFTIISTNVNKVYNMYDALRCHFNASKFPSLESNY